MTGKSDLIDLTMQLHAESQKAILGRIRGCTRVLGKSQGYYGLPIRDVLLNDTVTGPATPAMQTVWMPTPDELAALIAGAPIMLGPPPGRTRRPGGQPVARLERTLFAPAETKATPP